MTLLAYRGAKIYAYEASSGSLRMCGSQRSKKAEKPRYPTLSALPIAFNTHIRSLIPRLALLWHFRIDVCERLLTVGASEVWRPCEEVENGLSNSWHARLRRRSSDSFFSAPLPLGGGIGGRRRRSWSSRRVDVIQSMIGLQSGRGRVPPSIADEPAHRSTAP